MNGLDSLKAAILAVPVPGAPLSFPQEGAAVGLAFLEASLRQNHIRRLTERISLKDHGVGERRTELDVSLGMLDPIHRSASDEYQRLRSKNSNEDHRDVREESHLWVPVARLPRRTSSP